MTLSMHKHILPVATENLPEELTIRPQWVVWKADLVRSAEKAAKEKLAKIPYSARTGRMASSTDLLTWATFEEACTALAAGQYIGLGFVFSSGDPYTGVDLDGCVDPQTGEIRPWAMNIIGYLDSYTELSATGAGVHIIVRGELPNRRKEGVEIYSTKRFFTMTGHVLEIGGD